MKAGATEAPKSDAELLPGGLENLSREATAFVRRYPGKARQIIVAALEKAAALGPDRIPVRKPDGTPKRAASSDPSHGSRGKVGKPGSGTGRKHSSKSEADNEALRHIPEHLRPFAAFRPWNTEMLNVTEAAVRLKVSRTTIYDWIEKKILLGWESTKRGRTIPAEQILGPGNVVPGIPQLVEIIGHPELVWIFLSEECPFANDVMRPIDKLKAGEIEEVLGSAPNCGSDIA